MLSMQKKITYTEKLWGNYFTEILQILLLICPRSELISEICNFYVLSMAQQNYISDSRGNQLSAKTRKKLHK